jgi:hypothetical protein
VCSFRSCSSPLPCRVEAVITLPSALLVSDSCARCTLGVLSTVGAAVCSAPSSSIAWWSGAWPRAQSPKISVWLWCIPASVELCSQPLFRRVVERLVCLPADPEMMQQDRQLPGNCDDRAFLSTLAQRSICAPSLAASCEQISGLLLGELGGSAKSPRRELFPETKRIAVPSRKCKEAVRNGII